MRTLAVVALSLAPAGLWGCTSDSEDGPAGQAAYEVPSLGIGDLGSCRKQPAEDHWRCGRLELPFERADASYGTTKIGFAVLPHSDRGEPSAGAIFAIEGGPGYASTATSHAYTNLFKPLLADRDLVLVDMRGTGRSHPVKCPDLQRVRAPDWISTSDCSRRLGKRFESYRTSAAADDIDALVLDSAYPAYGEDPWYPSLPRTANRSLVLACERSPECSGDPSPASSGWSRACAASGSASAR